MIKSCDFQADSSVNFPAAVAASCSACPVPRTHAMPVATPDAIDQDTGKKSEHYILDQDFSQLTNIEDIRNSLRLLDEEETRIDANLDAMLAREPELLKVLGTLDSLRFVALFNWLYELLPFIHCC